MIRLCEYGCGKEGKHQFKNGKWCCESDWKRCPIIAKSKSEKMKAKWDDKNGLLRSEAVRKKRREGVKRSWVDADERRETLSEWNNEHWKDENSFFNSKEVRKTIGESTKKSWNDPNSKFNTTDISKTMKRGQRKKYNAEYYIKKYPFFAKIEELRQDPNTLKIQVHCKNHNCKNSKENGGWYTPTQSQFFDRIRALEKKEGRDTSYFYCCDQCKDECPLHPFKIKTNKEKPVKIKTHKEKYYTSGEYNTFRDHVLHRDNYECQYCGEPATIVHHERPQKLEPFFALDPDLAWSVCKKCHYEKGHPKNSECGTGQLAHKTCER